MNKYILSLVALLTSIHIGLCDLSSHITLQYSRIDGTLWECNASSPQISLQVGTGPQVGVSTNTWNGHTYWINAVDNTLIKDGISVGPLQWWDTKVWDAQRIYGFAISDDGVGWLATQDLDSGTVSFLLSVNLANAWITVMGPMGDPPSNPNIVNGLIITHQLPAYWVTSNGVTSVIADYTTDSVTNVITNIPSMYLSMPDDDWFSQTNGIYSNPQESWERICNISYLNTNGGMEFSRTCWVSVAGCSTSDPNRMSKHSFDVKFKKDVGNDLIYPFYGSNAAPTFASFRLDCTGNISWAIKFDSQSYRAQYVRDQYCNDIQQLMRYPSVHGKYAHVYLNGIYWGLYVVRERIDDHWCKSYYGGKLSDYDVIKNTCVTTEVVVGDITNYNLMLSAMNDYNQMKQYLDIDAFIDYMVLNFYVGNTDWAMHNWTAFKNRTSTNYLWRYINWDSEYTLLNLTDNVTGKNDGDPTTIHSFLRNNSEYRTRFAQRAAYQFNRGVLANPLPPYLSRIQEIDQSIVLEAARWGDSTGVKYTRTDWLTELTRLTNTYFPNRSAEVIGQLRTGLLYPDLPPRPTGTVIQ